MIKITNEEIIKVCKSAQSMSEAARILKIKYDTLKKYAIKLNVWNPNQSGKGIEKAKYTLESILSNKYYISSINLKGRLYKADIKQKKCEDCNITSWNKKRIAFELHHIDGDKYNNNINNLKILCPNCHSQTDNFRGRNK